MRMGTSCSGHSRNNYHAATRKARLPVASIHEGQYDRTVGSDRALSTMCRA